MFGADGFTFVARALAAFFAVQAWLGRRIERRGADAVWAIWAAAIFGWALLLLMAMLGRARSGYIPTHRDITCRH